MFEHPEKERACSRIGVERLVICNWSKQFPKKEGLYWFYGYRFGKVSCGRPSKPEVMMVSVRKISNGFMYVADGQFMSESEVECPNFLKAEIPDLPDI